MSVLLPTRGSRGDAEPRAGLAVRLRVLGGEVRVWEPLGIHTLSRMGVR